MTQRTVINSLAGATIAISASIPATYDAAGYGATAMVYTSIGKVENFGEHGGTKTITTFIPADTGTVEKVGGSIDYGSMALTIGSVPGNAGQVLLKTALANANTHYSIKLTYPDTEIHYMDVLVSKCVNQDGTANDVLKLMSQLDLCRAPVVVPQV